MSQAITLEPSLFPKRWKLGPVSLHWLIRYPLHVRTATWLILPAKNFTRKISLKKLHLFQLVGRSVGRSVVRSVGQSVGRKPEKCRPKNVARKMSLEKFNSKNFTFQLVGRSFSRWVVGLSLVTMSVGRSVGRTVGLQHKCSFIEEKVILLLYM